MNVDCCQLETLLYVSQHLMTTYCVHMRRLRPGRWAEVARAAPSLSLPQQLGVQGGLGRRRGRPLCSV